MRIRTNSWVFVVVEAPPSKGRLFCCGGIQTTKRKAGSRHALGNGRENIESSVIESVTGHYEAEEIAFGVVYTWCSGSVRVQCGCSKMLTLTRSLTTCGECGADHTPVVREELADNMCSEDEVLHPWRYVGEREGLPY